MLETQQAMSAVTSGDPGQGKSDTIVRSDGWFGQDTRHGTDMRTLLGRFGEIDFLGRKRKKFSCKIGGQRVFMEEKGKIEDPGP